MLKDYGKCRTCGVPLAIVASHPPTGQCFKCWYADGDKMRRKVTVRS